MFINNNVMQKVVIKMVLTGKVLWDLITLEQSTEAGADRGNQNKANKLVEAKITFKCRK